MNKNSDVKVRSGDQISCLLELQPIAGDSNPMHIQKLVFRCACLVTGLSRLFVEVYPFANNGHTHSFIIIFMGLTAAQAVCTFGEHVRNNDSPLHVLPELRDIYSRAVFRVMGSVNGRQSAPAPEISERCKSRLVSQGGALCLSAAPGTDTTTGFRISGISLEPDSIQFNQTQIGKDSAFHPHLQAPVAGCANASTAPQAFSPKTNGRRNLPTTTLRLSRHIIVSIPAPKPALPRCHSHHARRLRLHRTPLTQISATSPGLSTNCTMLQGSNAGSDGNFPISGRVVNLSVERVPSVTISSRPPRLLISETFRSIDILDPLVEPVRPERLSSNNISSEGTASKREQVPPSGYNQSARGSYMFESKVEGCLVESSRRELSQESETPIYVIRKSANDLWND